MTKPVHDPRLGAMLGFLGGLVLSVDVPMLRLSGGDMFSALAIRSLCTVLLFMPLVIAAQAKALKRGKRVITRQWLEIGAYYGIATFFFNYSVYSTSTANLVFILALNPLIAALIAWLLLGERPGVATWLAIAATIAGVGIIVGSEIGKGSLSGDIAAFFSAFFIALLLVRSRQNGADYSLTPGFGALLSAVVALPLAAMYSPMPQAPAWLVANGLIVVPLAMWCLALAPRFIPAPQVAMFYLLETVLAPIWVWYLFGDRVTQTTLIGGMIVLAAITCHSMWDMRVNARRIAL